MKNKVMIQYFEWYLPNTPHLWNILKDRAKELYDAGFTSIWMPPAYKGVGGNEDVGYGVYDVYDLGEFDAKGSVETKYGTREEYLACVDALHQSGLEVISDIVLNHKMGADGLNLVIADEVNPENRMEVLSTDNEIVAYTLFTFPARHDKYSSFHWDWSCFDGVDYDEITKESKQYLFNDKSWARHVDDQFGNFDYLMGANLDFSNPKVVKECTDWAKWYLDTVHNDGFRLDAVKHIEARFYRDWIKELRDYTKQPLFTVGEYWHGDVERLLNYLQEVDYQISLFDVSLHFHMYDACHSDGAYDMGAIFENTLVKRAPDNAVTFVDNHDTEPGQGLESFIDPWFKPMAYALILLREEGYPCVFYGDYYGIGEYNIPGMKDQIDRMLRLRETRMNGERHDYFDHHDVVGWTYEGNKNRCDGFAVLMTDAIGGEKYMYIGKQYCGFILSDGIHKVKIDKYGGGVFYVNDASLSLYTIVYKNVKGRLSRRSQAWRPIRACGER